MDFAFGDPPPQCFSCGKEIRKKEYRKFYKKVQDGELQQKVLDEMNFFSPCCRRMFISDNYELRKKIKMYDHNTVDDSPTL